MTRYIAQFVRGGFPEIYQVVDTSTRPWTTISDPQSHHDALNEAGQRNDGSWGKPEEVELPTFSMGSWLAPGG